MSAREQLPHSPAPRVAIVTDSTCYLPRELIERDGIATVSLHVGWSGELLPEHEYGDAASFYARLREGASLPKTSQPSVGEFLDIYRPLVSDGRDVVSLHIAEGLSGTCLSAREASDILRAEGHPGTVHVHDGQTGAGGLGCLVLVAAELAAGGCSSEEILSGVRQARETLDIWFCLDTLELLHRGGRIGAAQAMFGAALRIKPILTFGTEIAPVGRVRTKARAMERMVQLLRELQERGASDWIVQHAQSPAAAESLVQAGREIFGYEPLFCTEVGPVLGAHLGAGVLVGGFARPRTS